MLFLCHFTYVRIAFGHYCSAGDISGVSTWLLRLATYLRQEGVEVAVHFMDLRDPGELPSPLEVALREMGVEIFTSPARENLRKDVQETLDFLNAWQPEIYLPQCKTHHYVAAAIAGLQGLPWALTLHSDDSDYWAIADSLPPEKYGGRTVCVSSHIQSELTRHAGPCDASVIPYGVPIPNGTAGFHSRPFRVVYSGRLWDHQKRISLVTQSLIKACGIAGVEMEATVIGDGYARAACEKRVWEADMQGRITFVGRQPFSRIQEILQKSQAILLMSDFEGLPVALLEAMAAGVVPVARSIPSGIPELVMHRQTGLLVGEDPDGAAAALAELAMNPPLWKQCSEGARQLVQARYSLENSHRMWVECLAELQTRGSATFPLNGKGCVDFTRLSPQMLAPYKKDKTSRLLQVRQRTSTAIAQLKGEIKSRLRR